MCKILQHDTSQLTRQWGDFGFLSRNQFQFQSQVGWKASGFRCKVFSRSGLPPSPTCIAPTLSRLSCTEALQCLGSCTNALQYMVSWTKALLYFLEHKMSPVKQTHLIPFTVGQAPCMVRSSLKYAEGWKLSGMVTILMTLISDHDTDDTENNYDDTKDDAI